MKEKNRAYSYLLKLHAVHEHVDLGIPLRDVAKFHGIRNRSTLQNWCVLYRKGGAAALQPKRKESGDCNLTAQVDVPNPSSTPDVTPCEE